MTWLDEMFEQPKPVLAMCHFMALPGDPGFDEKSGMKAVIDRARRELMALQDGGVDGVIFSNEFSLPYLTKTEPITSMAMARIIGELHEEIRVPFGVNVLWDGQASIDLAVSVGASYVREIFTGVYGSDFGLWDTNIGATARHRHAVGGDDVRLLFNIVPEAAAYLGDRTIQDIARSTVFNCKPDALCVSGLTAGAPTDTSTLMRVKEVVGDTPVVVNTGMKAENAGQQLSVADAAVVGSFFKKGGIFEEEVQIERVRELMAAVGDLRKAL